MPASDDFTNFPADAAYLVRQYRPAYFTGFETEHYRALSREDILNAPWAKNFKQANFTKFVIKPYTADELIVSAHYDNGEHWVVGFACRANHRFKDDWRYGRKLGNVA